jgi:hypothetical protein
VSGKHKKKKERMNHQSSVRNVSNAIEQHIPKLEYEASFGWLMGEIEPLTHDKRGGGGGGLSR